MKLNFDNLGKVVATAGLFFLFQGMLPLAIYAQEPAEKVKIEKIAVMPALESYSEKKIKKLEETLDCQLIGLCSLEDTPSLAEETMTRLLQSFLRKKHGDKVVSLVLTESASSKLPVDRNETSRQRAARLGKELQTDHVLVCLIWKYEERVGSSMAATSPASVAFSLYLVDVQNNTLVWQEAFDKTQSSLSDNLFDSSIFFKKGFKWLSAEELASFGIDKVFVTFP